MHVLACTQDEERTRKLRRRRGWSDMELVNHIRTMVKPSDLIFRASILFFGMWWGNCILTNRDMLWLPKDSSAWKQQCSTSGRHYSRCNVSVPWTSEENNWPADSSDFVRTEMTTTVRVWTVNQQVRRNNNLSVAETADSLLLKQSYLTSQM